LIEHATETILEDEKYKVLREFTSIYGIGPVTANTLYARKRCRTLDDVKRFYENPENTVHQSSNDDDDNDEYEDKNKRVPESWIQVSLALKDELSTK